MSLQQNHKNICSSFHQFWRLTHIHIIYVLLIFLAAKTPTQFPGRSQLLPLGLNLFGHFLCSANIRHAFHASGIYKTKCARLCSEFYLRERMTNDGKCLSLRSTVYLTCEHRGPMLRSCSNQVSRPSGFSAGGGAPLLRFFDCFCWYRTYRTCLPCIFKSTK